METRPPLRRDGHIFLSPISDKPGFACTSWHKASTAPELWTKLSFKAKAVAHGEMTQVCSTFSLAMEVELHGAICIDTKVALGVGGCLGGAS